MATAHTGERIKVEERVLGALRRAVSTFEKTVYPIGGRETKETEKFQVFLEHETGDDKNYWGRFVVNLTKKGTLIQKHWDELMPVLEKYTAIDQQTQRCAKRLIEMNHFSKLSHAWQEKDAHILRDFRKQLKHLKGKPDKVMAWIIDNTISVARRNHYTKATLNARAILRMLAPSDRGLGLDACWQYAIGNEARYLAAVIAAEAGNVDLLLVASATLEDESHLPKQRPGTDGHTLVLLGNSSRSHVRWLKARQDLEGMNLLTEYAVGTTFPFERRDPAEDADGETRFSARRHAWLNFENLNAGSLGWSDHATNVEFANDEIRASRFKEMAESLTDKVIAAKQIEVIEANLRRLLLRRDARKEATDGPIRHRLILANLAVMRLVLAGQQGVADIEYELKEAWAMIEKDPCYAIQAEWCGACADYLYAVGDEPNAIRGYDRVDWLAKRLGNETMSAKYINAQLEKRRSSRGSTPRKIDEQLLRMLLSMPIGL